MYSIAAMDRAGYMAERIRSAIQPTEKMARMANRLDGSVRSSETTVGALNEASDPMTLISDPPAGLSIDDRTTTTHPVQRW